MGNMIHDKEINSSSLLNQTLPLNYTLKDHIIFKNAILDSIPATKLIVIDNCSISYDGFAWVKFKFVKDNRFISKRVINKLPSGIKAFFKILYLNTRLKKEEINVAILIFDDWSSNYFHWITESLTRLILLNLHFKNATILLPKHLKELQFINQTIKIINSNNNIYFVPIYQYIKAQKLITTTKTAPTGSFHPEVLKILKKQLRDHFTNVEKSNKYNYEKVFVSRENAKTRKILNFNETRNLLKKYDIHVIEFENYDWHEQILMIINSQLLIGVHGAGLTNMLFMKDNSSILELRRFDDVTNNCYFAMANALNYKYYYQLCEVDDLNTTTQNNNFYIDNEKLEANIQKMLNIND